MEAATLFQLLDPSLVSTPALIFDRSRLRAKIAELQQIHSEADCHFLAAVKSFPLQSVIDEEFLGLAGFDISNYSEYALLPSYLRGKTVWLTDPTGKSLEDLPRFLTKKNTLILTVETPQALFKVPRGSGAIPIVLRLRSPENSRFGMQSPDNTLVAALNDTQAPLAGFHIHRGLEMSQPNHLLQSSKLAVEWAKRLKIELQMLNLGGGLGQMQKKDWGPLFRKLRKVLPSKTQVFFEPGRSLTEPAGFAVGTILRVSRIKNTLQCVTDLSASCHLRWAKPLWVCAQDVSGKKQRRSYDVHWLGPTCSEYDRIGRSRVERSQRSLALLKEGNRVVFSRIPGYSLGWNRSFNGIPGASVYLAQKTNAQKSPLSFKLLT